MLTIIVQFNYSIIRVYKINEEYIIKCVINICELTLPNSINL